jgi:putative DNA primase/helicase
MAANTPAPDFDPGDEWLFPFQAKVKITPVITKEDLAAELDAALDNYADCANSESMTAEIEVPPEVVSGEVESGTALTKCSTTPKKREVIAGERESGVNECNASIDTNKTRTVTLVDSDVRCLEAGTGSTAEVVGGRSAVDSGDETPGNQGAATDESEPALNVEALKGAAPAGDEQYPVATVLHSRDTSLVPASWTWADLKAHLSAVEVGDKDGPAWLAGTYKNPIRSGDNWVSANLAVYDGDKSTDPGDDVEKAVRDCADDPALVHAALVAAGLQHCVYTSHSNGLNGDPNYFRWRVVIPCDRDMVNKAELAAVARASLAIIRAAGGNTAWSNESAGLARLWYLPRIDPSRPQSFQFLAGVGATLSVDACVAWWAKHEAVASKVRNRLRAGRVIDRDFGHNRKVSESAQWFNQSVDALALLQAVGYSNPKDNGSGVVRLESPWDLGSSPGVLMLPGRGSRGPALLSFHSGCDDWLEHGHGDGSEANAHGVIHRAYTPTTLLIRACFKGSYRAANAWINRARSIIKVKAEEAEVINTLGKDGRADRVAAYEKAITLSDTEWSLDFRAKAGKLLGGVKHADSLRLEGIARQAKLTELGSLAIDWGTLVPEVTGTESPETTCALDCPAETEWGGVSRGHAGTVADDLFHGVRWPHGYRNVGDEIIYETAANAVGGAGKYLQLAKGLSVRAMARGHGSSDWGLLLAWHDSDGVAHEEILKRVDLATDKGLAPLIGGGARISPISQNQKLLREGLGSVETDARVRTVKTPGWHGDRYLWGGMEIAPKAANPAEVIRWDGANRAHKFHSAGTLEEWQINVAAYAVGNSRLILGIATGFAGSLLAFYPGGGGGIHLKDISSTGKTTAAVVGGSVIGGDDPAKTTGTGYAASWNSTGVGVEGLCSVHSDSVMVLDDIGASNIEPEKLGGLIYQITSGQGRQRGDVNGDAKERASFATLLLSTGEIGLDDLMRKAGTTAASGQEARILSIKASPDGGHGIFETLHGFGSGADFSDALKAAAARYYGTALPAFVRQLVEVDRADIVATITAERAELLTFIETEWGSGVCGQVQRVIDRIAMVSAAGRYAELWGTVPWPMGTTSDAMKTIFRDFVYARGNLESGELNKVLEALRKFITGQLNRFNEVVRNTSAGKKTLALATTNPKPNSVGFIKDGEFLFQPEHFQDVIKSSGVSTTVAVDLLIKGGFLLPGAKGRSSANVRVLPANHGVPGIPREGKVKVYRIPDKILGSGSYGTSGSDSSDDDDDDAGAILGSAARLDFKALDGVDGAGVARVNGEVI